MVLSVLQRRFEKDVSMKHLFKQISYMESFSYGKNYIYVHYSSYIFTQRIIDVY